MRDVPWNGYRCYLEYRRRRFWCDECEQPCTEKLDRIAPYSRLTRRYAAFLFEQCRMSRIEQVSRREQIGYKVVEHRYYHLAEQKTGYAARPLRLGIDEIALKKGRGNDVLIISDADRGSVIAVLLDRTRATLEAYFGRWSEEERQAVTAVALDLWQPYHLAVAGWLPKAQIVADRFHVMRLLTDAINQARREKQCTMAKEAKQARGGLRWLLVKHETDVTSEEREQLVQVAEVAPALKEIHSLKEQFRAIFERERERTVAAEQLRCWATRAAASGSPHLARFVTTLHRWWDVVLNYFCERLSSGFVEGLNAKLKLLKRIGFGYRNFDHFRLRALSECDGSSC